MFARQMDMQFEEPRREPGTPGRGIEEIGTRVFQPEVRIRVDCLATAIGDGFGELLGALDARMPVVHREEDADAWIGRGHQSTLEDAIGGPLARERAGVALALVAGMQVMRQMLEIEALAGVLAADLERILTPVVRAIFQAR